MIFLPWFMSLPQKTLCNIVIQFEVCIAHSYTLSMSVSPRARCLWYDDRHTVWSAVHAERYNKSHHFLWNLITEAVLAIRPGCLLCSRSGNIRNLFGRHKPRLCVRPRLTCPLRSDESIRACDWSICANQGNSYLPPFPFFCDSLFLFLSLTSWPTFSVSPPESHLKTGLMRSGQGKCSCLSFPRALYIFRTPNPQHFFRLTCRCPAISKEGETVRERLIYGMLAGLMAAILGLWCAHCSTSPEEVQAALSEARLCRGRGPPALRQEKGVLCWLGTETVPDTHLDTVQRTLPCSHSLTSAGVTAEKLAAHAQSGTALHKPKHCFILLASGCSFSKFWIIYRCKQGV